MSCQELERWSTRSDIVARGAERKILIGAIEFEILPFSRSTFHLFLQPFASYCGEDYPTENLTYALPLLNVGILYVSARSKTGCTMR